MPLLTTAVSKLFNPIHDKHLQYLVEHLLAFMTCCKHSIARHQLLAAFPWNFSPFLMGKGLQFTNILGFACCNCIFKSHQRFSNRAQVRWLMATLVFSGTSSEAKPCWTLRYAWDHCPVGMMPKLQLPHRGHDIFSQDFLILDWIHLALHMLQVSSARGSEAAPKPHWATAMLHCRQGVFSADASFFLLQTYRWSTGPKSSIFFPIAQPNRIPNLFGLFIVFSNL